MCVSRHPCWSLCFNFTACLNVGFEQPWDWQPGGTPVVERLAPWFSGGTVYVYARDVDGKAHSQAFCKRGINFDSSAGMCFVLFCLQAQCQCRNLIQQLHWCQSASRRQKILGSIFKELEFHNKQPQPMYACFDRDELHTHVLVIWGSITNTTVTTATTCIVGPKPLQSKQFHTAGVHSDCVL